MLVTITERNHEEVLTTTSRQVAEVFEKRHADVLIDIESMNCSKKFTERNFALSTYKDSRIRTKAGAILFLCGSVYAL